MFPFSQPLVSNNIVTLDRSLKGNSVSTFREIKGQGQTLGTITAADRDSTFRSVSQTTRPPFTCLVYFHSTFYISPSLLISFPCHHALALPCGSTSFASLRASELARSVLAGVTAKIKQLSLVMNCRIMSLICCSMSTGWSPTGTLVIPGRSMRVRFSTAQTEECNLRITGNTCVSFLWHIVSQRGIFIISLVFLLAGTVIYFCSLRYFKSSQFK